MVDPITFFNTFLETVKPLGMFLIGVVIYSVFIFKAYKFIGKRDIFEEHKPYKDFKENLKAEVQYTDTQRTGLHFAEYLLFYPLVIFVFFLFFFLLMVFLKESVNIGELMLVSIAVVGAVRVTSYISEDLSMDLAKMLPFALLAVYIIDIPEFAISTSFNAIMEVISTPAIIFLIINYLLFIIILEFFLRIVLFSYKYLAY